MWMTTPSKIPSSSFISLVRLVFFFDLVYIHNLSDLEVSGVFFQTGRNRWLTLRFLQIPRFSTRSTGCSQDTGKCLEEK